MRLRFGVTMFEERPVLDAEPLAEEVTRLRAENARLRCLLDLTPEQACHGSSADRPVSRPTGAGHGRVGRSGQCPVLPSLDGPVSCCVGCATVGQDDRDRPHIPSVTGRM